MRIPFLWCALALLCGLVFYELFPLNFLEPPKLIVMALGALPILWFFRKNKIFPFLFFLCVMFLGVVHAHQHERSAKNGVEYFLDSENRLSLEGVVISDPEVKIQGKKKTISFILEVRNVMRWKGKESELFDVKGKVQVFLFQAKFIPDYSDIVRLKGFLEKPKPVLNPGEFDYAKFLKRQNICCVFKGFGKYSVRKVDESKTRKILKPIHKLRLILEKRIEQIFISEDAALLKAVLLGRKKSITPEVRDAFMKTGTAHLFTTASRKRSYSLFSAPITFVKIA